MDAPCRTGVCRCPVQSGCDVRERKRKRGFTGLCPCPYVVQHCRITRKKECNKGTRFDYHRIVLRSDYYENKNNFFNVILTVLPLIAHSKEELLFKKLTPEIIFHKFPVCSLPSSLGQWCKALSENERKNFSFSKLPGSVVFKKTFRKVEIIKFSKKELFIQEDDWFHTFIIEDKGENNFEVQQIDDGNTGSYHTKVIYKIIFDNGLKNWKIVAEKLIFDQGEKLDNNFVKTGEILFLD